MAQILKQEYTVTNPFDEQMMIEALQTQLSSLILKEVINGEKDGIKVTFTLEVLTEEE